MTPAKATPPLYFVNAAVDYALIGGVSLLTYALLAGFHAGERTDAVMETAAILMWAINWPHFSATSYRLYSSRENVRQYPITAFVVPVLLAAAVVGSFASPEGVAPYLVKFFLVWSPYHFSGQTVGISLLYARRAGVAIGRSQRLALSGFVFGTFLLQTALAETGSTTLDFYTVSYPMFGLPLWVPRVLRLWMWACGGAFLLFVVHWSVAQKRLLPPIVLLPAVTQFVWFVLGADVPSYNEFVPLFHSLQYLVIAWAMQLKEKLDTVGRRPSPRYVVTESVRWGLFNFAGGAVLFWVLPRIGASIGHELAFATAVTIAAVQIHHFFVDGVIWKLRNPKVASPLLVNIGQLLSPPPTPAEALAVGAASSAPCRP